jgi:hypothetical protein
MYKKDPQKYTKSTKDGKVNKALRQIVYHLAVVSRVAFGTNVSLGFYEHVNEYVHQEKCAKFV